MSQGLRRNFQMRLWPRALGGLTALAAAAALAPSALASTTPSISLDQGAGHQAGSTANLGLNLSFANSGTDSPRTLTLNLPPGLLANAAIDNGACLKRIDLTDGACQIGTGTVSAEAVPAGLLTIPVPVSLPVTFHLVAPPRAGDLAGLAVYGLGQQIGSTGDITIRPSGSSDGVGATIALTVPDQLPANILPPPISTLLSGLVGLSIRSIDSTFDGLRYPATCPSAPAQLTASVDSYQDPTAHPLSAPLTVTGCGSLDYAPRFSVSAARDRSDQQVMLSTNITEGAADAPSRSVSLAFPTSVLGPNLQSVQALCASLSPSCSTVGSVTAASPLYPAPLTGRAYLTGSSGGLALTLVFPSPFPLTLTGAINLAGNSATFTGLPDIPLSSLAVTLDGGPHGLFLTNCQTPSGTATATLTDQNGDRTRSVPAAFGVAGCPGAGGPGPSVGAGGGAGDHGATGSGSGGASSRGATASAGGTRLAVTSVRGLRNGKPSITFRVSVTRRSPRFNRLTVGLPSGLAFTRHRIRHRLRMTGVSMRGARTRSLALSHRRLVITLRRASSRVTATLRSPSMRESAALRVRARRHRLRSLRLEVTVHNTRHRNRTLTVTARALHL